MRAPESFNPLQIDGNHSPKIKDKNEFEANSILGKLFQSGTLGRNGF